MHKDTASQVQFHCSFLPGSVPLQMSLKIAMYCFFLMLPIILTKSPIRFDEKHPQNIKLPPPYRGDNILEQISLTILPWKVFDKITLFFYFIRLSFIFRMNMIFRKFHIGIQMGRLQKREHAFNAPIWRNLSAVYWKTFSFGDPSVVLLCNVPYFAFLVFWKYSAQHAHLGSYTQSRDRNLNWLLNCSTET